MKRNKYFAKSKVANAHNWRAIAALAALMAAATVLALLIEYAESAAVVTTAGLWV